MPKCGWKVSLSPPGRSIKPFPLPSQQQCRFFHPITGLQSHNPVEAEHAALIDTSSLRNTLNSIREANRTRLIRKVDGDFSEHLSLSKILEISPRPVSKDVAAIEQVERRQRAQKARRNPKYDQQKVYASIRRFKPSLQGSAGLDRVRAPRSPQDKELKDRGRITGLTERWLPQSDTLDSNMRPWLARLAPTPEAANVCAHERLSHEIEAFAEYISPSLQERTAADQAVGDLRSILKLINEEIVLEVIGSRSSGLASPLSDIDVNLYLNGQGRFDFIEKRAEARAFLSSLTKKIRRHRSLKLYSVLTFIGHSKVPILKLAHIPTGLQVEIQSTNTAFNGLEYAKSFQREYPFLRNLFLVLRNALHLRGLDIGANGGLTSYPLMNMLVASIKSTETEKGSVGTADHLLGFLELFSAIDFSKHGISVIPFKIFDLEDDEGTHFIELLGSRSRFPQGTIYVKDPADPSNNLGSAMHRSKDVQATITNMKELVQEAITKWDATTEQATSHGSPLSHSSDSLLSPLLEADWRSFNLARKLLVQ